MCSQIIGKEAVQINGFFYTSSTDHHPSCTTDPFGYIYCFSLVLYEMSKHSYNLLQKGYHGRQIIFDTRKFNS